MQVNEGFRPGCLEKGDKVRVLIQRADEKTRKWVDLGERIWPAHTCYWGKDRPVRIVKWERVE